MITSKRRPHKVTFCGVSKKFTWRWSFTSLIGFIYFKIYSLCQVDIKLQHRSPERYKKDQVDMEIGSSSYIKSFPHPKYLSPAPKVVTVVEPSWVLIYPSFRLSCGPSVSSQFCHSSKVSFS
ncbi:hypothetical protein STEG23_018569, partial [Scotinomys teguina]